MNLGRHFAWASLFLACALWTVGCDSNNGGGDDNDGGNNDGGGGDSGSDDDAGDDNDAGDDASVEPGIVDVVDAYADALCDLTASGCDTGYDEGTYFLFRIFSAEGNCKDSVSQYVADAQFGGRDLQRLLDSGDVTVDRDALDACLADLVDNCKFQPSFDELPCMDLFEGTVALGDDCFRSEECAGDAYCDTVAGNSCPGTCVARKEPGESCNSAVECSKGEFDNVLCFDSCIGTNVTTGGLQGQDCGVNDGEEEGTAVMAMCAKGYFCSSPEGGSCTLFSVEGGVCSSPVGCPPGTDCTESEGDGPDRCTPVEFGHDGDDCTDAFPNGCAPFEHLTCVEGTCTKVSDGNQGDDCSNESFSPCEPGLYCEANGEDDDTCEALKDGGDPCTDGDQCSSGQCNGEAGCAEAYCVSAGDPPPPPI